MVGGHDCDVVTDIGGHCGDVVTYVGGDGCENGLS